MRIPAVTELPRGALEHGHVVLFEGALWAYTTGE
jgi:hypothetical protein